MAMLPQTVAKPPKAVYQLAENLAQKYQINIKKAWDMQFKYQALATKRGSNGRVEVNPHEDPERQKYWKEARDYNIEAMNAYDQHQKVTETTAGIPPLKQWLPDVGQSQRGGSTKTRKGRPEAAVATTQRGKKRKSDAQSQEEPDRTKQRTTGYRGGLRSAGNVEE